MDRIQAAYNMMDMFHNIYLYKNHNVPFVEHNVHIGYRSNQHVLLLEVYDCASGTRWYRQLYGLL